ncbi:Crp/Fnr family transcriptional regulator [Tropicimonas sp. IMCC34043]|uniref:Crp/Fnr family transcriptional regulator n=1 Tax=Tropicimonas sp. IMCC34043 TaxID=2248760 RepID=UPI000E281CD6|nr:Crp/Fnr family transcriptional regulator [Tropicimonas sp. IMCC34043]
MNDTPIGSESPDTSPGELHLAEARDFLSRTGWLAECAPAVQKLLLHDMQLRRYPSHEAVFRIGDEPDGLYGFVTGGLRILAPDGGGEAVWLHRTEPGYWIGEMTSLSGGPRLISLVTTQPTVALHLTRDDLVRVVESNPTLHDDLYALSRRNWVTAVRLLVNLTIRGSERRLAMRLLHYDEIAGSDGDWIPLNQEALADLIAVSLPTLQRALRNLVATGCIEVGYGKIRVNDRAGLIARCNR